jgi:formamidopyrimidine-DNA glycosylase
VPELPDVETVRRYLIARGLVGRAITGAQILWPRAVRSPSEEEFVSEVSGRRIIDIRRRGKYVILDLDGRPARVLILHLRMTGSLLVKEAGLERPRHTRNVLLLDGGEELCFVDPRKFGVMWLVADEADVLAGLGPEPLDPAFTSAVLARRLSGHTAPVKALLCDQRIVAGIGNIYADEALFASGIHPLEQGGLLSPNEGRRLHRAVVVRLTEAIQQLAPLIGNGGPATESREGLERLLVPRSEGVPCSACDTPISRVIVRGRSSYFCGRCQAE